MFFELLFSLHQHGNDRRRLGANLPLNVKALYLPIVLDDSSHREAVLQGLDPVVDIPAPPVCGLKNDLQGHIAAVWLAVCFRHRHDGGGDVLPLSPLGGLVSNSTPRGPVKVIHRRGQAQ